MTNENTTETFEVEKLDGNTIRLIRTIISLQSREELLELKTLYENERAKIQTLIDDTNTKIMLLDK